MQSFIKRGRKTFKVGDLVQNVVSGSVGTVDRVNLGADLADCVLVRFHDKEGNPQGDGYCVPRKQLEVIR